jgi:hypothetical protein
MQLHELINQVPEFDKMAPRDKIRLFAWYLHTHKRQEHFGSDHIRALYKELYMVPDDVGKYIMRMHAVNNPDLARERQGFKLTRAVRSHLDAKYGGHPSMQAVSELLTDLPDKVPDVAEKVFLAEAIDCYRVKAYRACIVMIWNLAFDHLLNWILKEPSRLTAFNAAVTKRFQNTPKKTHIVINRYDDFADDLKEFEIIELCKTANLLNDNLIRTLKEKLGKRNAAAHPSTMVVVQSQADDVVTDLVNNVVLALT